MNIHIGTSGWQYRDWNETFYPADLPAKEQLAYYAQKFSTVEINSTFYHSPRVTTCEKWYEQTPDNFVFTVKMFRGITHYGRLVMDEEHRQQLADFCTSVAALGNKLGMILVQLPPSLKKDLSLLEQFVEAVRTEEQRLGVTLPLTLEVRNDSWFDDETVDCLNRLAVGWVINDSPNRWPSAQFVTANKMYLRFHGSKVLYKSSYTDEELKTWAGFIASQSVTDVWVYFNNDYDGVGPENAERLKRILAQIHE